MSQIHPLYDLTPMIGRKANDERTTVIMNMEMKPRTKWVGIISLIPALLVTGISYMVIKEFAIIFLVGIPLGAHFLINARSQTGLQRRTFEQILDKRKSGDSEFYLCWSPIKVSEAEFEVIRRTVTQVQAPPI